MSPIEDVDTAVIRVKLSQIRQDIEDHAVEDKEFQQAVWKRLGPISSMRYQIIGILTLLGILAGAFVKWGPWFMSLAVQDVVAPRMKEQADESQKFIGAKLDAFKKSVDDATELQNRRIEALEHRRPR